MKEYRVKPGSSIALDDWRTDDTSDYKAGADGKEKARQETEKLTERLGKLQEKLYAGAEHALLIVLQGMDTSGKDGTVKHVMHGIDPQGCRVAAFKAPTESELAHDFLWRIHREVPAKRYIGIFNRSHYEDVVTVRVLGLAPEKTIEQRIARIVEFEKMLAQNNVTVLKFFLHISKAEQKRRLEDRVNDPTKRWKWDSGDLGSRALWKQYMKAYAAALSATSTEQAPWYVIPADYKWYRNLIVADIVVSTLEAMDLKYPPGPKGVDWKNIKID